MRIEEDLDGERIERQIVSVHARNLAAVFSLSSEVGSVTVSDPSITMTATRAPSRRFNPGDAPSGSRFLKNDSGRLDFHERARFRHLRRISELTRLFPVVGLIGPRQVGKSTLARQLAAEAPSATSFDLEDDADLARLADPYLALSGLRGLVVIDEIQHRPGLFPMLRVLADRPGRPATFVVLGSAGPALLHVRGGMPPGRWAEDKWHYNSWRGSSDDFFWCAGTEDENCTDASFRADHCGLLRLRHHVGTTWTIPDKCARD